MTTGKHTPVAVEKADFLTSPGHATQNQANPRQNQQPSATLDKPITAGSPLQSDAGYRIDVERSNHKGERILLNVLLLLTYSNQGPERRTLMTRLKLAVGLSIRSSDTTNNYRVSSIIKPRKIK